MRRGKQGRRLTVPKEEPDLLADIQASHWLRAWLNGSDTVPLTDEIRQAILARIRNLQRFLAEGDGFPIDLTQPARKVVIAALLVVFSSQLQSFRQMAENNARLDSLLG